VGDYATLRTQRTFPIFAWIRSVDYTLKTEWHEQVNNPIWTHSSTMIVGNCCNREIFFISIASLAKTDIHTLFQYYFSLNKVSQLHIRSKYTVTDWLAHFVGFGLHKNQVNSLGNGSNMFNEKRLQFLQVKQALGVNRKEGSVHVLIRYFFN